jgi:hypothetical protein
MVDLFVHPILGADFHENWHGERFKKGGKGNMKKH